MTDKSKDVFEEITKLVPDVDLVAIKKNRGGKLRFPVYINETLKTTDLEALDLSVRSNNCLHRAGYRTIGDLVEAVDSSDDLKRIKNCGSKSVNEIMEKLFCYQYRQMCKENKLKYIRRVVELNQ